MEEKINLNFFGEEICIPVQKDLTSIRSTISTKFCFTDSDAQEILLYYIKGDKKIIIKSEEDYKIFLQEKTKKIILDISQSSKIYQKNLEEIKRNEMNEELKKLYKKRDELKNLKNIKFEKEMKEIEEIKASIKKMKLKKKKLKDYIKEEENKIEEEKVKNEKKIIELENKLRIKSDIYFPKINKIDKYISHKNNKHLNKNKKEKKLKQKKAFIQDIEKIMKEKKQETRKLCKFN